VKVHRLVLEAFVGVCPRGYVGCHSDGDPENNRLSNLRWDSQKNNVADQVRHGTFAYGIRNGRAKLNAVDLERISDLHQAGVLAEQIGPWLGYSARHVRHVITGACRRHG
jgi:hypothetical protein